MNSSPNSLCDHIFGRRLGNTILLQSSHLSQGCRPVLILEFYIHSHSNIAPSVELNSQDQHHSAAHIIVPSDRQSKGITELSFTSILNNILNTFHKMNDSVDNRDAYIPPWGCIHPLYSTRLTLHYHITRYPMVSHHAPTYFHSSDDTYTHWSEPTHIHHANVTATNGTQPFICYPLAPSSSL